jgi:hypothetical protein
MKIEKLRNIYKLKYLILQHGPLTWLCVMNLFIKIKFLFYQKTIKKTHLRLVE